jgi:hypothetical protein
MTLEQAWQQRTRTDKVLRRPRSPVYVSLGHKQWRNAVADAYTGQSSFTKEDEDADDWYEADQ